MASMNHSIKIIRKHDFSDWRFEIDDFANFRQSLGLEVVNAFARCFVHADRVMSLNNLVYLSGDKHGQGSTIFHRDLHTSVWFVVGTLRELALAICNLRSALAKSSSLDLESKPWVELTKIEKRWEDDPFFREMRNTVSFHVDPEIMERGLQELESGDPVVIFEGEGEWQQGTSLRIGLHALLAGHDMSIETFERFITVVADGLGIANTISEAFILAVEKAGIQVEELETA